MMALHRMHRDLSTPLHPELHADLRQQPGHVVLHRLLGQVGRPWAVRSLPGPGHRSAPVGRSAPPIIFTPSRRPPKGLEDSPETPCASAPTPPASSTSLPSPPTTQGHASICSARPSAAAPMASNQYPARTRTPGQRWLSPTMIDHVTSG